MMEMPWPIESLAAARAQHRWFANAPDADPQLAKWLEKRSIDWRHCENLCGPIRVHPITRVSHGSFEFIERGPRALIFAVYDQHGNPQDLAAWLLDKPCTPLLYLGDAALMGAEQIINPATYRDGQPLQIRRDIFDWLQAGCDGVCILSATHAAPVLGRAPGPLAAHDEHHGYQLLQALQPYVEAQQILIPATEQVAA